MPAKMTFDIVQEKAIIKHSGFYTYNNVINYYNQDIKYNITCPLHGDFSQKFSIHLEGRGCKYCGRIKQGGFNLEKFKIDGANMHDNFYDYTDSVYHNRYITIKCPIHGEFNPRVDAHLEGVKCSKCSKARVSDEKRLNVDQIKSKFYNIWGDLYDLSLIQKIKTDKKPKYDLICKHHGVFKKRTDVKDTDKGCSNCSSEARVLSESIVMQRNIDKHGDTYDYSLYNYTGMDNIVKIICKTHGVFEKSAYNHMNGIGCIKCSPPSQEEVNVKNFLSEFVEVEHNNRTTLKKGAELDILIPTLNLAVEYNGVYFHSDKFLKEDYHLNKTTQCQEKEIKLIHIFEDEWLYKKEVVKSKLLELIGKSPNIISAKDCEIKILTIKQSNEFLKNNDLTEDDKFEWGLGLHYKGELVQLLTLRNLWNNSWEILRFCNKLNTNVLLGNTTLLKYFENNYYWNQITTEVDLRWDDGTFYKSMDFKLENQTKPNYFFTKGRIRTNKEEEGFHKIYDCGTLKFRKENFKSK